MSLSKKIWLYFLVLAFIAVTVLGLTYIYYFQGGLFKIINSTDTVLAKQILQNFDLEISNRLFDFDQVSKIYLSLDDVDDPDLFVEVLRGMFQDKPEWNFIYILDSKGNYIFKEGLGSSVDLPIEIQKQIDVGIANAITDKTIITDIFLNSFNNEPTFLAVKRLSNDENSSNDGGSVYYLVGSINWSTILRKIVINSEGIGIYITDKDGRFLGSTDPNNTMQYFSYKEKVLEIGSFLDYFSFKINKDSLERAWTQSGYGLYGGHKMSIYINRNDNEINTIVGNSLERTIFVLLIVALLIVIALAAASKTHILKPIKRFIDVSKLVAKGDYGHPIKIESEDEFGDLARVFNKMVEDISSHNFELENKIKEKTKELENKAIELSAKNDLLEKNRLANIELIKEIDASRRKVMERNVDVENKIKERTQQLNEQQTRLIASINSMPTGFIMADVRGAPIINNVVLYEILKLDGKTVGFHDFKRLILMDMDFDISLAKCIADGVKIEKEDVRFGEKLLNIHMAPIKMNHPEEVIIGAVILISDTTEERIFERSKDEFFAVASHELRTPLTAIKGNADMIITSFADKIQDTAIKEMLGDIKEGSERLIEIVNDFLEVARLEQGSISLNIEEFSIEPILKDSIQVVDRTVVDKKLKLELFVESDLPMVRADKSKIQQVMINLIGNAVKFTERGGIKIEVKNLENFVKVSVSDTGLGIAQDKQSLLFRKFQPAGEMLTRDVTKSTGLGLYISKLIVSKMGGTIALEKSEVGKGSVFSFTIPVV